MKHTLIIIALAMLAASGVSAAETSLSVFMLKDTRSDQSGFGAALSMVDEDMTDLSYMDLGSFTLAQFAKLSPRGLGPYNAYFGFAAAFAKPDDASVPGVPKDWLSGLALMLGKTDLGYGLSLDLRASSLSKDFDPIAWFTDPDLFIVGAGLSYKF